MATVCGLRFQRMGQLRSCGVSTPVPLLILEWVWWFNNQRLHSELDYRTPAEVEAEYYAENTPVLAPAIHGKQ